MGGRPLPDAHPLRRASRLRHRVDGHRRGQVHVRDPRRRRLLRLQVRGRHPPRAARPRDRVPGTHPHLHRDRRRAARSRGGGRACRSQRSADRRLPLLRPRRAVGQHDRLGRAHHPPAVRDRRLDAGREVPAAEPRARSACSARAAVRARPGRTAGRARRRPPLAGRHRRPRREDPHIQLRRAPRHRPPHRLTVHNLDQVLEGQLDELTAGLQADERRLRLQAQAAAS